MSKHVILHWIELFKQVIKPSKRFATLKSKLHRRSDVSKHPTLKQHFLRLLSSQSIKLLLQQHLPSFQNLTLHLML